MMTDDSVTEGTPPEKTSRWEDYIDIFFSPAELFRRRASDRIAPPLLTLLGLAIVFYLIMLPAAGIIMRASLAANPQAAAVMNGRMGTIFMLMGSIMVPITYSIMLACTAFLLWLIGRIADTRTVFGRTMLIATYAGFVMLLSQVAGNVMILIHGEAGLDIVRDVSFGALRFVGSKDMDQMTMALLRRFELFAIWQAVLWAIGLREIYKISTGRAAFIAAITWALFALPAVIMAALGLGAPGGAGGASVEIG
jgi:hypothetical protein